VEEMSASTHHYNAQLIDHLTTLRKVMEQDKESTALKNIGQTDCTRLINSCLQDLKMLQFQCLKAVSSVEERLLPLKVNQAGDGSKAPARTIEVLPDCTVTVVVEVQDRKLPLKVHVQYEKKPKASKEERNGLLRPQTAAAGRHVHNTELYGDLAVHASQTVKEPDAEHHSQHFVNPRARLLLRNHTETSGREKAAGHDATNPLLVTDTFTTRHMYISLYSLNGCTVTLAAQFPSEEDKSGGKKAVSLASC
jgi:hypothetical protein